MKTKITTLIILFLAVISISGIGFINTKPQKVLLVR